MLAPSLCVQMSCWHKRGKKKAGQRQIWGERRRDGGAAFHLDKRRWTLAGRGSHGASCDSAEWIPSGTPRCWSLPPGSCQTQTPLLQGEPDKRKCATFIIISAFTPVVWSFFFYPHERGLTNSWLGVLLLAWKRYKAILYVTKECLEFCSMNLYQNKQQ